MKDAKIIGSAKGVFSVRADIMLITRQGGSCVQSSAFVYVLDIQTYITHGYFDGILTADRINRSHGCSTGADSIDVDVKNNQMDG